MSQEQAPPNMKTLDQVFESWNQQCLAQKEPPSLSNEDGMFEEEEEEDASSSPPSEVLRQNAQTFFRNLHTSIKSPNPVFKDGDIRIETKSPHEIALAKVIQDLGAAFAATAASHQSRYRALNVLVGAIQGCKEASFSNTVIQLVGNFLVRYCGPIEEDEEYGEDYDSLIRNMAVHGLVALVQLSASNTATDAEVVKALQLRLKFAQEGIEMRCAVVVVVPDTMAVDSDDMPPPQPPAGAPRDMREQLSNLPRSKRSLCFELIGSAIQGVSAITNQINSNEALLLLQQQQQQQPKNEQTSNVQQKLVHFARFAACCLHGESDPRCLQQLLTLFHQMQEAFEPYFLGSANAELVFPSEDLFDAVAPYFPIQFSPPPNNVHGITSEGLSSALLAVLCYTNMDKNATRHKRIPMINLAIGLFLEQLVGMQGEEPPSTFDKLEGIECLSQLLFPENGTAMLESLDTATLRNLSMGIQRTHDASCMEIGQPGRDGDDNKRLADDCRTLVSKLALALEMLPDKSLWDTFVSEPLLKQKKKLHLSPSRAKLTIAYMACLTASGGPRTLRFCLGVGLESLLDYLVENLEDTADASAAAHGIGAFFSSSTVAISRGRTEGIVFHPHPLAQYVDKASAVLMDVLEKQELSTGIKVGATRALEFLTLAVPEQDVEGEVVPKLFSFIELLMQSIIDQTADAEAEWIDTCSSTLGVIIGNAMEQEAAEEENAIRTILSNDVIRKLIKEVVSPKILGASTSTNSLVSSASQKTVATACRLSESYSSEAVDSLLESLKTTIASGVIDDSCIQCSEALSSILRDGGDNAIQAYHDSKKSSAVLKLLGVTRKAESANAEKISNLSIPKGESKDTEEARAKVQAVISNLLPAYEKNVPAWKLMKLSRGVAGLLPPLSEADKTLLSNTLPILGSALSSIEEFPSEEDYDMGADQQSLQDICVGMLPGLTELIFNAGYASDTRTSAAFCMHTMLSLDLGRNDVVQSVVDDLVQRYKSETFDHHAITDWLKFLSLMASSAAKRGGSSSNTAGKVAQFFVELATLGKAQLPFTEGDDNQLDLNAVEDEKVTSTLRMVAASAYGSMIALDVKPLMKQRLTHTCIKYIKATYEAEKAEAKAGNAISAPNVGLLVVISHLICSSDLQKMNKMTLHQTASIAVEGLSSSELFDPNTGYDPKNTGSKNLVLVAILKLLSISPQSVPAEGFLLTMVTGLLQAYAVSHPSLEVSSKLLALQGLAALANLEGAKKAVTTIQPAVISVLGPAINHPSGILRQAAADVRNVWYLVE